MPALRRLADEVTEHRLGDDVVGDDPVLHRPDGLDVAGRPADHLAGFLAHRHDPVVVGDRHDAWFGDDDALALDVDEDVGGAEVDADLHELVAVVPSRCARCWRRDRGTCARCSHSPAERGAHRGSWTCPRPPARPGSARRRRAGRRSPPRRRGGGAAGDRGVVVVDRWSPRRPSGAPRRATRDDPRRSPRGPWTCPRPGSGARRSAAGGRSPGPGTARSRCRRPGSPPAPARSRRPRSCPCRRSTPTPTRSTVSRNAPRWSHGAPSSLIVPPVTAAGDDERARLDPVGDDRGAPRRAGACAPSTSIVSG